MDRRDDHRGPPRDRDRDRGGPPQIIKEYYYRPRLAPRGPIPVPADQFLRRTGGLDGHLTLKLTCLTPVHVGTGLTGLEGGRAIMLTARNDVTPVIPGSAFKGALRTIGEALARSCHDQRCRMCYPCLVFGAVGYRARATFGHAVPDSPTRPLGFLLPMRTSRGPTWDENRIRMYNHHKAQPDPRGVELVETLPAGTVLTAEISYQSLDPAALGYLLLVTGAAKDHGFLHKIGAARSQGLGSVKLEVASHTVRRTTNRVPMFVSEPAPAADELVRAYLEAEKPHDGAGVIAETLSTLREKSLPLEVPLP